MEPYRGEPSHTPTAFTLLRALHKMSRECPPGTLTRKGGAGSEERGAESGGEAGARARGGGGGTSTGTLRHPNNQAKTDQPHNFPKEETPDTQENNHRGGAGIEWGGGPEGEREAGGRGGKGRGARVGGEAGTVTKKKEKKINPK